MKNQSAKGADEVSAVGFEAIERACTISGKELENATAAGRKGKSIFHVASTGIRLPQHLIPSRKVQGGAKTKSEVTSTLNSG